MSFRFFKRPPWDIRSVEAPWGDTPSIYGHILAHLQAEPGLKKGGEQLPDEGRLGSRARRELTSGALDGTFGHNRGGRNSARHVARKIRRAFAALTRKSPNQRVQAQYSLPISNSTDDYFARLIEEALLDTEINSPTDVARKIRKTLAALTRKSTNQRAQALYSLLISHNTDRYTDLLMEEIVQHKKIKTERLCVIARWIATGSPDREPVRVSIAILGLVRAGEDRDLLVTLGRHDEFALYAAVALKNIEGEPEPEYWLWELAKYVTGWGRIQIINRLAGTTNGRIKAWLLREGFRNEALFGYTALICANSGNLLEALRTPQPDESLLKGAGEILRALIDGPRLGSKGIKAYTAGAEAAELLLEHLGKRELNLEDFLTATTIERFLEDSEGGAREAALGWPQRRTILLGHINAIRSRPGWEEDVQAGLASENQQTFWLAAESAKALGIDTWDIHFERLLRGQDHWYEVMQTDNVERIDRVVQLAEERLPLRDIASGHANELDPRSERQQNSALEFVLQDLRRFPRRGWPLIRAGLQSPVSCTRHLAVRAVASWQRDEWPPETDSLLRDAFKNERGPGTRELIRKVMSGETLESHGPKKTC